MPATKYQLPTDASNAGLNVDTVSYVRSSDGATVADQVTIIGDGTGNLVLAGALTPATSDNALRVRGFAAIEDLVVSVKAILNNIARPLWVEPATSRVKVTLDAIAGALTLAAVTTVTTVTTCATVTTMTNQNQWAAVDLKQSMIFPTWQHAWAVNVRGRIT